MWKLCMRYERGIVAVRQQMPTSYNKHQYIKATKLYSLTVNITQVNTTSVQLQTTNNPEGTNNAFSAKEDCQLAKVEVHFIFSKLFLQTLSHAITSLHLCDIFEQKQSSPLDFEVP